MMHRTLETWRALSADRRFVLLLLAVCALAALLRFPRIATAPGWFIDEGIYFDTARNMAGGHAGTVMGQIGAFPVAPYMTAPPAWLWAEAWWMKHVGGFRMEAFRRFVAASGVLCVFLTGLLGRRLATPGVGLAAALLLAVAPRAVLYSRMAIPYTPATALILVAWLACLSAPRRTALRQQAADVIGASAAVLSTATLLYAIVLTPALGAYAWMQRRAARPRTLVLAQLAVLPLAIPAAVALYITRMPNGPAEAGIRRNIELLLEASTPAALWLQLVHWWDFLTSMPPGPAPLRWAGLPIAGFLGLFLLRRGAAARATALLAFLLIHIVLRRLDSAIATIDYPVIPVLPLLCIGAAALLLRSGSLLRARRHAVLSIPALPRLAKRVSPWLIVAAACAGLATSGLAIRSNYLHRFVRPALAFGMLDDHRSARETARWIDAFLLEHRTEKTLVVATPNLWPLFREEMPINNHCDLGQWMLSRGHDAGFYRGVSRNLLLFSPGDHARVLFVEDPFTEQRRTFPAKDPWPEQIPGAWVETVFWLDYARNNWPVLYQNGSFTVRGRPGDPALPGGPPAPPVSSAAE